MRFLFDYIGVGTLNTLLFNFVSMGIGNDIRQEKFKSEFEKLVVNLIYTKNWFNNQEVKLFKPFGITPAQFNVLRILRGQFPESSTTIMIVERMLDKMSNVSRLVDKLVLKDLVTRKQNNTDRRAVDIRISPKGLEILEVLDVQMQDLYEKIDVFSEHECKLTNDLLDRFRGKKPD